MNVLLIDNRDSFTFNLAEACGRLASGVEVVRNDIDAGDAFELARSNDAVIILSPGPGRPVNAGCSLPLVTLAKGRLPLLGICLGHQAIALEAGGTIEEAPAIVHGKSSLIAHDNEGPFEGLPNPLRVGRYHSLCTNSLPTHFTIHSMLDGMAMAISSRSRMQVGLQFHPESILTPCGDEILMRCLGWLVRAHA
jgi:anthranilate synthase/aminodeoxychorismate synthase-like glutamine amidotransferase